MSKEVILTGIRANDEPTLGNYLGAFLPMVELQKKYAGQYQINMFVPDLHSFTTPIDHGQLYANTMRNLKYFVAAGLDINDAGTYVYRQSFISAHAELTWILDCFTGYGEAARMVEFKDKSERLGNDQVTVGLFNYPILMAADILLYRAKWVPVGEDQRQHLELTRTLAERFNNKFGEVFVVPESTEKQLLFAGRTKPIRIRSLRSPDKKMSKSVSDPAGTILMSDSPEEAAKKVMSATTDSLGVIHFDFENQPGVANLLQIESLLTSTPLDDVVALWDGKSRYGDLKKAVAQSVHDSLRQFQSAYAEVDEELLVKKLEEDEVSMRAVASETLHKVQKAVGLRAA